MAGNTLTREAASVTIWLRIMPVTSSPSSRTRLPSSPGSRQIEVCAASLSRPALSSKGSAARSAFRAKARYIAPVSRFSSPKCWASSRATVLLPAPDGPSMATMIFRAGSLERKGLSSALIRVSSYPAWGRAVKPNRLLFPALVPAVRTGLWLLCAGRASLRESLRELVLRALVLLVLPAGLAPLLWLLRWLHAGAADFALLPAEAPLVGRLPLPLGRVPVAGREPLAGRESEEVRRAGRLPVAACAGLRSRL